jgi:ACS family phthalate transporter-like MFS transporter
LQFQSDLNLTDASYGLGVGLFYVGYIEVFEPWRTLLSRFSGFKREALGMRQ